MKNIKQYSIKVGMLISIISLVVMYALSLLRFGYSELINDNEI